MTSIEWPGRGTLTALNGGYEATIGSYKLRLHLDVERKVWWAQINPGLLGTAVDAYGPTSTEVMEWAEAKLVDKYLKAAYICKHIKPLLLEPIDE